MCFSATVSFIAGSSLSLVGLLSVLYARSIQQRAIAAIPLCFGIQQIAEGIVWKGIEAGNDIFVSYGAHTFLFFAFFFWPIWIPFSMRTIESHEKRRKILDGLLLLGVAIGCYLIYHVVAYGISVQMTDCHILYTVALNQSYFIPMLLYLMVTIVPFFIVRNFRVNIMGITLALSYLLTYLFYIVTLISVWCFFAAIISVFAVWIIHTLHPSTRRER